MKFRGALVAVCFSFCAWGADIAVVEEIVAKVNGDIITRTEIERARVQTLAELKQRKAPEDEIKKALAEREESFLRDKIDQLLLVQKGKELNVNVDAQVSKQLAEIQLQYKMADSDEFQKFLREQTGMSFEDYKAEMRNSLLTQTVIRQEVGSRVSVPRDEVRKYYEEHKKDYVREETVFLREIFLSTDNKDAAQIEKKAKELAERARKGEKFPELARDNSDAVTSRNYGELGGFKRGELRKDLEDLVFGQQRGFVSDPIKMDKGFLILRVDEHFKAGQASFEEVESEINERLFMPRFQPKIREYLTELRGAAFLEIKEGYTDSAPAPGKSTRWTDPAELKPETITKEEVASQPRRRRLLWLIPIPGTEVAPRSSSR